MRAAILTLDFYNNFGSVLQAYALRVSLQKIGVIADIVPYRPNLPKYEYFKNSDLSAKYKEKELAFQIFREKYLKRKREDIISSSDIPLDYDAYIVGSDIIWGKEFSGLDTAYFLDFVTAGKKKISYAASMVLLDDLKSEDDSVFKKYIPQFDSVSVREKGSIDFLSQYTKHKVVQVLDPSLLLEKEEYDGLAVENDAMNEKPYLLCYFLTHSPAIVDYSILLAKKLGLRVIHFFADYPDRIFPEDSKCFAFSDPGEFLGYVKNAACIFTNSFHGTCFSVIYRKPFYVYMEKRKLLSRISGLIENLHLQDRYFEDFRDIEKVKLNINYEVTETILSAERDKSIVFLKESLGEI